jgi:hypothetical protein
MKTLYRVMFVTVLTVFVICLSMNADAKKTGDPKPDRGNACSSLRAGADHNLYGLCNAFCEAQHCDSKEVPTNSCKKLLKNFNKRSNGKVMPCLSRFIPEGATIINEKEYYSLQNAGELIPINDNDAETQNESEVAQMQEDLDTVLAFKRATGSENIIPVDPVDPTVTLQSINSYEHTIMLKDGSMAKVTTLGKRWMLSSMADAIRTFPTRENQFNMYKALYDIVVSTGSDDVLSYLVSPAEMQRDPGLYSTQDIMDNISVIFEFSDAIMARIPRDIPVPATIDCGAEVGSGTGSDRTNSYSSCGAFDSLGLYARYYWNNKYDHTCVKSQGSRGACVAFAVTAATEFLVKKKFDVKVNLSEQDLYNKMKLSWEFQQYGDGFTNTKALTYAINTGYLIPFEYQWNYNPSLSRITYETTSGYVYNYTNSCDNYNETCSDSTHQSGVRCTSPTNRQLSYYMCSYLIPKKNPNNYGFRLKSAFKLWDPDTKNSVKSLQLALLSLKAGINVLFGVPVTPQFDKANCDAVTNVCKTGYDSGVLSFVPNEDPEKFRGGHALLAVGFVYNSDLPAGIPDGDGGGYIIVKNSWGSCWGDGGYLYMPFEFLKMYAMDADVLLDIY